jgi:hypothetical protein
MLGTFSLIVHVEYTYQSQQIAEGDGEIEDDPF